MYSFDFNQKKAAFLVAFAEIALLNWSVFKNHYFVDNQTSTINRVWRLQLDMLSVPHRVCVRVHCLCVLVFLAA